MDTLSTAAEESLRFSKPELRPEQFHAMAPFDILCAASF